jgi:hypothetical protein
LASLGLVAQLQLGPEIVNFIEEIERKGQARQVESKITLEAFRLGDTDNTEHGESPVRSRLANGLDDAMLDQLGNPIGFDIAGAAEFLEGAHDICVNDL